MPKCKFCGQAVKSAVVFHSGCWENAAHKAAETFCDEYCRFPREAADEDTLEELHCSDCALIQLLNLGL